MKKTVKEWRKATPEEIAEGASEMVLIRSFEVDVDEQREVALWKLRAVLASMGMIESIEDAINVLDEPTKTIAKMSWEYGNIINDKSPTVLLIKQSINLNDEQFEEIFTTALNINI